MFVQIAQSVGAYGLLGIWMSSVTEWDFRYLLYVHVALLFHLVTNPSILIPRIHNPFPSQWWIYARKTDYSRIHGKLWNLWKSTLVICEPVRNVRQNKSGWITKKQLSHCAKNPINFLFLPLSPYSFSLSIAPEYWNILFMAEISVQVFSGNYIFLVNCVFLHRAIQLVELN